MPPRYTARLLQVPWKETGMRVVWVFLACGVLIVSGCSLKIDLNLGSDEEHTKEIHDEDWEPEEHIPSVDIDLDL